MHERNQNVPNLRGDVNIVNCYDGKLHVQEKTDSFCFGGGESLPGSFRQNTL